MKAHQAVVLRLTNLCRERKISINHLAYISAVPPSTVKNILYGNSTNTGVETLAKLCNGLEITLADFFNDDLFRNLDPEIE